MADTLRKLQKQMKEIDNTIKVNRAEIARREEGERKLNSRKAEIQRKIDALATV